MSSELKNLLSLLKAIRKSPVCGCRGYSDFEILTWALTLTKYLNVQTGFCERARTLIILSSGMTEEELLDIAKGKMAHARISPVYALGILNARYENNIPLSLMLEIIRSGRDCYTSNIAVYVLLSELMPLVKQIVQPEGASYVRNEAHTVRCGKKNVALLCMHPCAKCGNCDMLSLAKAIVVSPVFLKYMSLKGLMNIESVIAAALMIVDSHGIPEMEMPADMQTKFVKLIHIAKGTKASQMPPAHAVYSIVGREGYLTGTEILEAFLEIIRESVSEDAVAVVLDNIAQFMTGGVIEQKAPDIGDILHLLEELEELEILLELLSLIEMGEGISHGADIEISDIFVVSGGIDLKDIDLENILKQLDLNRVVQ